MSKLEQLLTRLKELDAEEQKVQMRRHIPLLLEVIETQREALESTSKNSCCDTCQQAKYVALDALARCEKVIQEGMK